MENIKNDNYYSLSELYHENSKMRTIDYGFYKWVNQVSSDVKIREVISKPNNQYYGYPSIALQQDILTNSEQQQKYDMFLERKSRRDFDSKPMSLEAMSNILFAADGVNRKETFDDGTVWNMRTAPSPGGLFPIDIFCVVQNVESVPPGIYSYSPVDNCLYLVAEHSREELNDILAEGMRPMRSTIECSAMCIMLVSNMMRVKFKYKERGYRFALLETGHIAQNISLAVEIEQAGAVCVGGFMDDEVNAVLDLDGLENIVQYCILIGTT